MIDTNMSLKNKIIDGDIGPLSLQEGGRMRRNGIAFFDFDGTLTKSDTFFWFMYYAVGFKVFFYKSLLALPILLIYKLHIISNSRAKEKVFGIFFKGWKYDAFQQKARDYSLTVMPKDIRNEAHRKIRWHFEKNHDIVIVSASVEEWILPWAKAKGLKVLATKPEIVDGELTGKFAPPNCYGPEKANRIREAYDLELYDHVFAYGDSRGDREMIALADEKHYRDFA